MSTGRLPNESFEAYRARCDKDAAELKNHKRGTLVFESRSLPVKKEDGKYYTHNRVYRRPPVDVKRMQLEENVQRAKKALTNSVKDLVGAK
jgi:hypothetical protein